MSQLSLFPSDHVLDKHISWQLFVDGASRGNPGPSGIGIYLFNQETIIIEGFYIGKKTNNQAEYLALIVGLWFASKVIKKDETLQIKADSQLLIRQILGIYKVKNPELKKLFDITVSLLPKKFRACHVPREENQVADQMANIGIDRKRPVPEEFKIFWQSYAKN